MYVKIESNEKDIWERRKYNCVSFIRKQMKSLLILGAGGLAR